MMLAEMDFNLFLMEHLQDHPWPGCRVTVFGTDITWMSSSIASMLIVAALLIAVIVPIARRRGTLPTGSYNVLELVAQFVRDMIARPALHEKAYAFMPLLLTIFVFVLGMNLVSVVPLGAVSNWLGSHVPFMRGRPVGAKPTSVLTVCAALAALSLLSIVTLGLYRAALRCSERRGWPMWFCAAVSPLVWVKGLAPRLPGRAGVLMLVPLALLELAGTVAKCFALMIRLFANMLAGHALLAVLMMFIVMALERLIATGANDLYYIAPFVIAGSVLISLLELLVAGLQAYIFTFLTAMFLGLYVEPEH